MQEHAKAATLPMIGKVTVSELIASLSAGWRDFKAAPLFGIFFSGFYVLVGLGLVITKAGTLSWVLALTLGFPLVGPFAAVGLYEVSRRLEASEPLEWGAILGVVWGERNRQVPWVGAIVLLYFILSTFLIHLVFALILGPSALINISSSLGALASVRGVILIVAELALGAVLALFLYSVTVVSVPLLLDKEVDFISAMILSFQTVQANRVVLFIWALIVAALLFLAMLPLFLGLFVILPILGHATWHLYRRALYDASESGHVS